MVSLRNRKPHLYRVAALVALAFFIASPVLAAGSGHEHHEPSFSDLIPYWVNFILFVAIMRYLLKDAAGNFWFSENAMDGDPFPPQAEELNQIPVALLNALQAGTPGTLPPDFGFPNCFPSYFTGAPTGSGCGPSITSPIQAFTPFLSTLYSQGATQIAFAPSDFPAPFNHGIFIAFAGNPPGERNPLIFYDLDTGTYTHFLLGGTGSIRQTGLLSTNSSLFISDFLSGEVFQITAGGVPEPGGLGLVAFGLSVIALLRRRRAF